MKTLCIIAFILFVSQFHYSQDENLDATFGTMGVSVVDLENAQTGFSLILQPDGKILLAGLYGIIRFDSDGLLDEEFGSSGVAYVIFYTINIYAPVESLSK